MQVLSKYLMKFRRQENLTTHFSFTLSSFISPLSLSLSLSLYLSIYIYIYIYIYAVMIKSSTFFIPFI